MSVRQRRASARRVRLYAPSLPVHFLRACVGRWLPGSSCCLRIWVPVAQTTPFWAQQSRPCFFGLGCGRTPHQHWQVLKCNSTLHRCSRRSQSLPARRGAEHRLQSRLPQPQPPLWPPLPLQSPRLSLLHPLQTGPVQLQPPHRLPPPAPTSPVATPPLSPRRAWSSVPPPLPPLRSRCRCLLLRRPGNHAASICTKQRA